VKIIVHFRPGCLVWWSRLGAW